VYALRQDGRDLNASDRRTGAGKVARWLKRRGERLSPEDRDQFLLTVTTLARLDGVSSAEFLMFCDNAIPPADIDR
jgi:hypothetical protein